LISGIIHLSNLNLPKSVEILALSQSKLDAPVVSVQLMKVATETESTITTSTEQTEKEAKEKDNKDKAKSATSAQKPAASSKSDKK
jgi:hypothetical protein